MPNPSLVNDLPGGMIATESTPLPVGPDNPPGLPESAVPTSVSNPAARGGGFKNPFSNPEFLSLFVAGVGDAVAAGFGHKGNALQTTLAITESQRKAKLEGLAEKREERMVKSAEAQGTIAQTKETRDALKFQMDTAEFIRKGNADDIKGFEDFMKAADKIGDRIDDPVLRENTMLGLASKSPNLPFLRDLIPPLAKDPALLKTMAPALDILKNDPNGSGAILISNARESLRKDPKGFQQAISHQAALVATGQITQKMPAVMALLKKQKGDKPITSEDVAEQLEFLNPVYASIVRGAWDSPTSVPKQIEALMTANGVQTVEATAKTVEEQRKAGVERGEEVKTLMGPVGETRARQAGMVAAEQEKARKAGGSDLSQDVRDTLKGMEIDPATASGAQIRRAQKEIEQSKSRVSAAQGREAALTKLEIPEKASPEERKQLTQEKATWGALSRLQSLFDSSYTGILAGRAAGTLEALNISSDQQAKFRSALAFFNNKVISELSGAAVTPTEFERVRKQLPEEKNPPSVFKARLEQSMINIAEVHRLRRETLTSTGVDLSKLPPIGLGVYTEKESEAGEPARPKPKVLGITPVKD
mgnify:CR=1 FL=1